MLSININQDLGTMIFDSAFPRNDYETKEQKKNAEGVPMWSVRLILRQADSRRSENLTVNIPSPEDPSRAFGVFAPVALKGLRVMTGDNDGRTWISFAADKIVPAEAKPAVPASKQ